MTAILLSLCLCGPYRVTPGFYVTQAETPKSPPLTKLSKAGIAPMVWRRVDSRGYAWTHADRAVLDAHCDALERGYAAPPVVSLRYAWPGYGYGAGNCASGNCARR